MSHPLRLLISCVIVVTTVLGLTACGDDAPPPLLIGSSDDPAMRAAAAVYAAGLTRAGTPATTAGAPVGSDAKLMESITTGEVDLFPAFTGDLLTQLSAHPSAMAGEDLLAEVARALPQGVAVGDPTGVSNRPQLVVSSELRERYGVATLQDCAAFPPGLPLVVVDHDLPEQTLSAFEVCRPGPVERVDDVQAVLNRVLTGQALGVLPALETAGAAEVHGISALKSDGAPRAQDLVPVYRSAALGKSALRALGRIAGELSTADLAAMADRVANGEDPGAVAAGWFGDGHS
ncbi:glycine betaine ABC transporter substrate-binding protein [Gordonia iterans]